MHHLMTLEEVNRRFDSEWVLFGDIEQNDRHEIMKARVLWHSKDRDEVYRKLLELRPQRAATHFTGTIPDGTAVVL